LREQNIPLAASGRIRLAQDLIARIVPIFADHAPVGQGAAFGEGRR
jgi:hypothetical protein